MGGVRMSMCIKGWGLKTVQCARVSAWVPFWHLNELMWL